MKHTVTLSLALLALGASATPAFAWDNYHGYDHYSGYHDYYAPSHVVYVRPATHVVYEQPYYESAGYQTSTVSCAPSFNPVGGIVGGVLGGVVGNGFGRGHGHTAAIITGAVLGTTIGGSAGTHCVQQVAYPQPAVVQQPVYVQAAATQVSDANDRTDGRYCREYQNRSTVSGRVQETYGTACMQPDGSWEIVD